MGAMPERKPPTSDVDDARLEVEPPETWAAGIPGIWHAVQHGFEEAGVIRSARTLRRINQKDGFDCPSCAWPDPTERHVAEFCENGAKAVSWEADRKRVERDFWKTYAVSDLAERSEYWLGQQGRLTEPVYKPAGSDHYEPISWDAAYDVVARELQALASPDEAIFYTSGRTSNEAAFVYQLFVRAFGTNNLPDCSNMCHESTSVALAETIGIGKASVTYDDFLEAELIIIMGQNPGTNHPRMLTALEKAKKHGASIVAVNPMPEAGLMRFKNPQRPERHRRQGHPARPTSTCPSGSAATWPCCRRSKSECWPWVPDVLDRHFLDTSTVGLPDLEQHLAGLSRRRRARGDRARARSRSTTSPVGTSPRDRTIVCWAMGLTQHKAAVATIREIVNLQALRGNIGKPGAGLAPIRGHSNVQGDRTMGIWEKPRPAFLDALETEFGIPMPREDGHDVVDAIRAMRDGRAHVFFALGGNFVSAVSDTDVTIAALRRTRLTVQVSTKLNRSHGVTGEQALILPTLGRTEIDVQRSGPQFVSVEDTVCAVHASRGRLKPASRAPAQRGVHRLLRRRPHPRRPDSR